MLNGAIGIVAAHYPRASRWTVPVATPNCAAILWKPGPPGADSRFSSAAGVRGRPNAFGAARLGPSNASAHPLDYHRSLELGKHAHHLKHGLARGRRCIDALLMESKINPEAVQLGKEGVSAYAL